MPQPDKRNPVTIAAELRAKISQANTMFVPVNVRDGLDLAAEFMDSVSATLLTAGLIADPAAPAPTEQPAG